MHGLRCVWLIGDGDSLVYNSVVTGVTSYGRHITKAECVNFAIKCYQNRLEAFCNNKPHREISVNMDCHGHIASLLTSQCFAMMQGLLLVTAQSL